MSGRRTGERFIPNGSAGKGCGVNKSVREDIERRRTGVGVSEKGTK